jgi:hypothetical protein
MGRGADGPQRALNTRPREIATVRLRHAPLRCVRSQWLRRQLRTLEGRNVRGSTPPHTATEDEQDGVLACLESSAARERLGSRPTSSAMESESLTGASLLAKQCGGNTLEFESSALRHPDVV